MKNVGIIGGSGYTGGELIRLVLQHPALELSFVFSTTRNGKSLNSVHQDLLGIVSLDFTGILSNARPGCIALTYDPQAVKRVNSFSRGSPRQRTTATTRFLDLSSGLDL